MSPLLTLTFLAAPLQTPVPTVSQAALPYVYKFVVGDRSVYNVRFAGKFGSQFAAISETLTTEVLSVNADGSASLKLTSSDLKKEGLAKNQPVTGGIVTVSSDVYGHLSGFASEDPLTATLAFMFAIPGIPLTERTWTDLPDPMSTITEGAIEGTIRSRKDARIVFALRTKATEGPKGTRETTFDTMAGRLVASKFTGGGKDVPQIDVTVERKAPR